jgi:Type II secretion system (T2SS), protein M
VSLSDRDRKLLMFIVPAVLIAAYWFLFLSPVRNESSRLDGDLAKQERTRDELQGKVAQLGQARNDFATDYAAVVELGKAVPTSVDMPSLIVQLSKASRGTGIAFERIHAGDRLPAASGGSSTGGSSTGGGAATSSASSPPVAAGGDKAQSGPGTAVEKANDTKAQQDSAANSQSPGSAPAPAAGAAAGTSETSGVAGLDAVPLEFTFRGTFFDLADFFHRMKRFVRVANDRINVRGRLMTVDTLDFKTKGFPRLEAQVSAKVYLAPKKQGATAGADPNGPAPAPSGRGSQEASSPSPSTSSAPSAVIAR